MQVIAEKTQRPGGRNGRVRRAILSAAENLLVLGGGQEPSIREIAEVAGVTFSTVSRRWNELLPEIQELRYGRLYRIFDELGEAPELGDLSTWTTQLENRLTRVAGCLRADPGAAIPLAVLSRFDTIAGDRLALAASQLGSTGQALVDQLVAPALHRSLVGRSL